MIPSANSTPLSILRPPYQDHDRIPVTGGKQQLRESGRRPGSVLVWNLRNGPNAQDGEIVRDRPGGLPLIVVLPETTEKLGDAAFLRLLESVRPLGLLPFQEDPATQDLVAILRQPPEDLAAEVTDYLVWRGIPLDRETARLIRKTIALSAELRSISALSRSLYLSRRALGRRFLARGLPVPSHWLQFGRLLRVAIRLQSSEDSVLSVGYDLGYPDGFSMSNQMVRLTGYRPVEVRQFLGWEWLLEAWMKREADTGGLAPDLTEEFLANPAPRRQPLPSMRAVGRAVGDSERKAVG
ncbi:MAG TPA: AraC family transcriptional regulator [Longimicrobiales bacterium]|nr:AraC family transcriptional regulator [Longimicrobiales bacterium]